MLLITENYIKKNRDVPDWLAHGILVKIIIVLVVSIEQYLVNLLIWISLQQWFSKQKMKKKLFQLILKLKTILTYFSILCN